MSLVRSLIFDNLGLKLVALLLAVVVYLNVYTDRPTTMTISFPIVLTDLADTLSVTSATLRAVTAELRGTGKQLIRLRVTEPPIRVSLTGVGSGRYQRALGPEDLPLPAGLDLQIDRIVTPRTLELDIDVKLQRRIPVAPRVEGTPTASMSGGSAVANPRSVRVTGPRALIAGLDSVRLRPVSIAGRRDTVRAEVEPIGLPPGCTVEPLRVAVMVPLEPGVTRRVAIPIQAPRVAAGEYRVSPELVTVVLNGPRRTLADASLDEQRAHWSAAQPIQAFVGRKVPVYREGRLPEGVRARLEPDSVTLLRVAR